MTALRPFFSFYGGKWRDARRYPPPRHGHIIEPFAGSAGYSVRHHDRAVTLVDADPVIAGVWRYLICVKPAELLSLPLTFEHVDDVQGPQEARWLIGFWLNRAPSLPRCAPSSWMRSGIRPGSFWGEAVRARLAWQVEHIRHWQVIEGNYPEAGDPEATWFVDPPYQVQGRHYRKRVDDYAALATWCRQRRGQVIVCEQEGADWLPFRPLHSAKTARRGRRSAEAVWP